MPSKDLRYIIEARRAGASGEGRRLRTSSHLTQVEVGTACGVAGPTIARWESGGRIPRGHAAVEYGKLLIALRRQAGSVALAS